MQDTTNSVWCFARLFHYPGAELLQAISLYCLRHWHRFKPQELANMIWSLALLRACSPHTWQVLPIWHHLRLRECHDIPLMVPVNSQIAAESLTCKGWVSVGRHALTQIAHFRVVRLHFIGVGSRGCPEWVQQLMRDL